MFDRFSACLNSFAHLNGFKQAILNVNSIGHSNAGTEHLGPLPLDRVRPLRRRCPQRVEEPKRGTRADRLHDLARSRAAPAQDRHGAPRALTNLLPLPGAEGAHRPRGEASALNKARNIGSMS
jgi:hypothetical protein